MSHLTHLIGFRVLCSGTDIHGNCNNGLVHFRVSFWRWVFGRGETDRETALLPCSSVLSFVLSLHFLERSSLSPFFGFSGSLEQESLLYVSFLFHPTVGNVYWLLNFYSIKVKLAGPWRMSTIRALSGLICSPWIRVVELDHSDSLVGCYCAVQRCESCIPAAFTW